MSNGNESPELSADEWNKKNTSMRDEIFLLRLKELHKRPSGEGSWGPRPRIHVKGGQLGDGCYSTAGGVKN